MIYRVRANVEKSGKNPNAFYYTFAEFDTRDEAEEYLKRCEYLVGHTFIVEPCCKYQGYVFSDYDVVNPIPYLFDSTAKARLIVGDAGVCVVIDEYRGYTDSDALDEAADAGKLDAYRLSAEDVAEREENDGEGIDYLGNASDAFDISDLRIIRLPAVPFSYAALFAHSQETGVITDVE